MIDIKKEYWEDSYKRQENYMFYPKEETVKFINRFIRKRTGFDSYGSFLIERERGGGGQELLILGAELEGLQL